MFHRRTFINNVYHILHRGQDVLDQCQDQIEIVRDQSQGRVDKREDHAFQHIFNIGGHHFHGLSNNREVLVDQSAGRAIERLEKVP